MSESGMSMTDQITAGLEAIGQAEAPAPDTSAPADPAPVEAQPEEAGAAPASDPAPAPTPLVLSDDALVVDPADGQEKPWGKIKSERLMQSDYTRKTQAIAEKERQVEALRQQLELATAAEKLKAERAGLPELPADDPYAQHQKMLAERLELQQRAIAQMQAQAKAAVDAANLAASQAALDAERKRMVDVYKFDAEELDTVESRYWAKRNIPGTTLQSVAKDYADYLARRENSAVKRFKDQHRVGAGAASDSTPATGNAEAPIMPGSPGFAEKLADKLAALL